MFRAIYTYAIRADNANISPSRCRKHLFLESAPLLCIHLAESSGEEVDSFDILSATIIEELQRRLSRNGYDNVIYISRDQPEAGENIEVTDVTAAGTDRINWSGKAGSTQVIHPNGARFYCGS
jgi:hypothetical protein